MKRLYEVYSESGDMTFIMEQIETEEGDTISVEVKGFYFGEPMENEEGIEKFYNKTKAIFK